jgi:hypothetical protein
MDGNTRIHLFPLCASMSWTGKEHTFLNSANSTISLENYFLPCTATVLKVRMSKQKQTKKHAWRFIWM